MKKWIKEHFTDVWSSQRQFVWSTKFAQKPSRLSKTLTNSPTCRILAIFSDWGLSKCSVRCSGHWPILHCSRHLHGSHGFFHFYSRQQINCPIQGLESLKNQAHIPTVWTIKVSWMWFFIHLHIFRMKTAVVLLLTGVGTTLQGGAHWNYLVSQTALNVSISF